MGGYIASRSLADCVMLAGPYPNTLKRVAYSLVSVQECVDQSSHLPIYASGDRPVSAQVGNVAAEAVNYFDAYSLVSVQECVDQSSHLPIYASGDRPVSAQVGNVAAEAVNYFDGDGDSIHVDRGLCHYSPSTVV